MEAVAGGGDAEIHEQWERGHESKMKPRAVMCMSTGKVETATLSRYSCFSKDRQPSSCCFSPPLAARKMKRVSDGDARRKTQVWSLSGDEQPPAKGKVAVMSFFLVRYYMEPLSLCLSCNGWCVRFDFGQPWRLPPPADQHHHRTNIDDFTCIGIDFMAVALFNYWSWLFGVTTVKLPTF